MEILKQIRYFLLDMDGTFILGDHLLPGALEFLKFLERRGLDYLFVTNNSSQHAKYYSQKLRSLGADVPDHKVFTSGEATTIYIKQHHPNTKIHVLGTDALLEEFSSSGIQIGENDADILVLGFDTSLTYEKLHTICNLVRQGKPYIATHPDINCPTEDGFMPDVGSIIALIETSTGRKPDVIIGKPNPPLVEAIISKTGVPKDQIAMVGDRLYTDIAMGRCGIKTILVLSGETTLEDLEVSEFKPDLVVENLKDLTSRLVNQESG